MEIINYEEENLEFEKRRLFETAEWTLLRLNRTINEMKNWTMEREILQNDIYRLKIALSYSEKSLGDALVIHQNEEIERLKKLNDDMRTKIKSLTLTLMNAESTVSWNTERKLRNEMSVLKSKMANDKLHLAREIMYLREKLNEKETDETTVYHEITVKLEKYSDEDNQLDIIFSDISRKLINTINVLSMQLISVGDEKLFVNQNISPENYAIFQENVKNYFKNGKNHFQSTENHLKNVENGKNHLKKKGNDFKNVKNYLKNEENEENHSKEAENDFKNEENDLKNENYEKNDLKNAKNDFKNEENDLKNENYEKNDLKKVKNDFKNGKTDLKNENHEKNDLKKAKNDFKNEKNDLKIENEFLLKEMEKKINKIFVDRELKVKAFKRDTSRLKTRLAIVQNENAKLIARINEIEGKTVKSVKNDFFSQTNFSDEKTTINPDNHELIEENKNLMDQLEMERTTAREALKEFEKSVNKTEEKINELKKAEEKINLLNNELMKLRIDNRSLKELKINYKKKSAKLDEESGKERELLINKINNLRGKLKKLSSDYRKLEEKIIENNKKIDENNVIIVNFKENEENYLKKIGELTEEIEKLKLNLIESKENLLKINEEFFMLKKINFEAEKLIKEFRENIEINLNELIELKKENEELKNIVDKKISTSSKECQVILSSSQGEFLSIIGENNSRDCTERIVEGSYTHETELIKDTDGIGSPLNFEKFEKIGNFKKDDKSMRGNWTIKNKIELMPEKIMKNLEDTDRQLLSVKCELSRVRDEIREMRGELKGKRFIIRRYQMENEALKEELARLRFGIEKLGEENKCLKLKIKK